MARRKEQVHICVRPTREEAEDEAAILERMGFRVRPPIHYGEVTLDSASAEVSTREDAWLVVAEA